MNILNKEEQTIEINSTHEKEIKEYLLMLDLIDEIEVRSIEGNINSRIVFTQPGMRYCQARYIIKSLLKEKVFNDLSIYEKKFMRDRILNEIKGRMMEDIVLFETMKEKTDYEVFRLQFAIGEYDMVVFDENELTCEIYEIKHSGQIANEQTLFLNNKKMHKEVERSYGTIKKKAILYSGESKKDGEIEYINVEEYLKNIDQC